MVENKEILYKLDKGEERRKADFSIWGYLYQFDLMLMDMLSQNDEGNFFNDLTKDVDAEYEIEMVEDYAKNFIYDNKQYIRIAQVKYHSKSNNFNDKEAIVLLYYAYLKFINLKCSDIDFKCGLFYYNKIKEGWDNKKIRNFFKDSLNNYMKDEVKPQVSMTEIKSYETSNKGNGKVPNNIKNRVKTIVNKLSNDSIIDKFINKCIVVSWVSDRQKLISDIKDLLSNMYSDYFLKYQEKRKDILYSLCINYIINSWQKKKNKSERIYIKLSDINRRLKELSDNEDETNFERLINSLRSYFDTAIKDIKELLLDDYSETEVQDIIMTYCNISENFYNYFILTFKNRNHIYSFLNTIAPDEFMSLDDYNTLNSEKKYDIFLENKTFIRSYISRVIKFIYAYTINNKQYKLKIENWFAIDDEMWLFKHPYENKESILLPKPHDRPKLMRKRILKRIYRSRKTPNTWLFGDSKFEGFYELHINKPLYSNDVEVDKPGYKKPFSVECMECFKEDEPANIKQLNRIFEERCVSNDKHKN
ncbi:hypothetical protein KM800_06200 [Clostridium tyrobutyricum]|uniref:hypothetical protein n=1 Tax=Clostridium tyrobutyricum TaxID=1519 RepID=UPI001C393F16|nr:hypothetical protein [Clostridium tyrobutyricum]MBV4418927.1 hypothetical protein [Clostridium tyrobutyricum]